MPESLLSSFLLIIQLLSSKQIKEGSTKITIDHEKLQANSKLNAQRLLILSIEVEQEKTGLTQTLIQELPISQRQILVTLPSARMGKLFGQLATIGL